MLLKNCKMIKNNTIIEGDILIEDDKIKKIGKNINISYNSGQKIDLKGKIVIGGVIDAHVHFRYGQPKKEDFISGSEASINGGVAYAIDMPNSNPPTTTKELFYKKYHEGKKQSKINIEFNFGITENNYMETIKDAKSYKIFMVKSVGDLFIKNYSKLKDILNQDKLFTIHAEHKDIIAENLKKYELTSWTDHCKIRDKKSEIEAIKEVLKNLEAIDKLNNKTPHIHFCHISTKEGLNLISNAKNTFKNVKITVEVAPHHIFLNMDMAEELKGMGKFNPPLRTKEDNKALINGIINKKIDIIATDHAPHTYEEKIKSVENCPSGIPGIETLVPLTLNSVNKKIINIFDAIRLISENPSKIFNIDNEIREGNKANLTIIDLNKEYTIKGENFKSKAKFTPFEGWHVKGAPIYTIINGKIYDACGNI
ncbi:dihydroorotase [Methanothermococcus okinawensis]|uniref:dihydroorotase n=1 Tax=Methanothermococcus okinawensis TaxID=155863 RepID=UPI00064F6DB0|nr:dihydroorotase [Methanothermococcus okinawensis]